MIKHDRKIPEVNSSVSGSRSQLPEVPGVAGKSVQIEKEVRLPKISQGMESTNLPNIDSSGSASTGMAGPQRVVPISTKGEFDYQTHRVEPGESLSKIASKYGMSYNKIVELNEDHFDNINLIKPGDLVIVPYQGKLKPSYTEEASSFTPSPPSRREYQEPERQSEPRRSKQSFIDKYFFDPLISTLEELDRVLSDDSSGDLSRGGSRGYDFGPRGSSGVNKTAIYEWENGVYNAQRGTYFRTVPKVVNPIKIFPRVGPEVGAGVDLGQTSVGRLRHFDVPEDIIQKVKPLLGYRGQDAVDRVAELKNGGDLPVLSERESKILTDKVVDAHVRAFAKHCANEGLDFYTFPSAVQTVLASFALNRGPDHIPNNLPKTWGCIKRQDWDGLLKVYPKIQSSPRNRRAKEEKYLRRNLYR